MASIHLINAKKDLWSVKDASGRVKARNVSLSTAEAVLNELVRSERAVDAVAAE